MRASIRALLVALGITALILAVAPAAEAGGPTSVLIVWPGQDTATALYRSDPEYQVLQDAIGEPSGGQGDNLAQMPSAGDYVTVTWLIHDVSIWRTDRIMLNGHRVTTVHTVTSAQGTPSAIGADHPAAEPEQLAALLDRLLTQRQAQRPGGGSATADPTQTATAATSSTTTPASNVPVTVSTVSTMSAESTVSTGAAAGPPSSPGGGGSSWWWALAGLMVGAGGTALVWRGRSLRAVKPAPPLLG